MGKLTKLISKFGHPLWHNYCRLCNKSIGYEEDYFCCDCWNQLNGCIVDCHCNRCGKELSAFGKTEGGCAACWQEKIEFDSITAFGRYQSPLSDMIISFKFADQTPLLAPLCYLANATMERAGFRENIDYVVPVPLHWIRRFSRGFNQSLLIAKKIMPNFPNAKLNTDLVRIKNTPQQVTLTPAGRLKNLKDAFAVRRGHDFKGKNVCLIDDVKTTGATLNECAKVLKSAGAKNVFAFVLAVAAQAGKIK